ncbi:MAG TPA: sigma-54 dependent transcriptional regulator [Candidatus Limnocylindria bacterium]|nr:sigma-54 dependent transcriptional regulator [Candidatus Limnocylindria bacterium]
MAALLIVDDEPSARATLALLLRRRGHHVLEAGGVAAAMKRLSEDVFDVIITDLRMPDGDGLDVLRAVKAHAPSSEVILLTAFAGWESAKEAIRLGALDYFEKGNEPDELYHRIDKALAERTLRRENENLRAQLRERYGIAGLVAQSPAMKSVLELVERVAPTDATLLIQGESGTGKEVIARAVHHASPRAAHPFVAVNCGAVPEALLESELFGHVRGSFTGAVASKPGLFEEANEGTLFLDEIGEMPAALQVKLLRVLQSREIRRLGATQPLAIDVRVLAATNRDLAEMLRKGTFREDLFYRLNVIQVALPPLRERREDIPALAEQFLARSAAKLGRALRLSADTVERLLRYPWPGNVRELENAIERAAILGRDAAIGPEDLPPHVAAGLELGPSPGLPEQVTLEDVERTHILRTLERFGGSHSGAAEALGIGRTTLWRKLKEYGIAGGG